MLAVGSGSRYGPKSIRDQLEQTLCRAAPVRTTTSLFGESMDGVAS